MNFSQALEYLKAGAKMRRAVWSADHYLYADAVHVYKYKPDHEPLPWVALSRDIMANDWMVVT